MQCNRFINLEVSWEAVITFYICLCAAVPRDKQKYPCLLSPPNDPLQKRKTTPFQTLEFHALSEKPLFVLALLKICFLPAQIINLKRKQRQVKRHTMSYDPFCPSVICYSKKTFCRESCRDQEVLNRLASSLVGAPYSWSGGHEFEFPAGRHLRVRIRIRIIYFSSTNEIVNIGILGVLSESGRPFGSGFLLVQCYSL